MKNKEVLSVNGSISNKKYNNAMAEMTSIFNQINQPTYSFNSENLDNSISEYVKKYNRIFYSRISELVYEYSLKEIFNATDASNNLLATIDYVNSLSSINSTQKADRVGLADIACFPGSSGSPIYILNEGSFFDKQGTVHLAKTRLLLLGILFAGPQYDAQGDIQIRAIPTSTKVVGISNTRIMANLGYYVKAHELNEFQKMIEQIVSAH